MNAVAKVETTQKLMLLEFMADKYGLRPQEFADTVRNTCGLPKASAEEFAAFMMVCREYDLNPMLREIYAFPKQGGGIVPIVSIDGWVNLVNSHLACDGFEFDIEHEGKELVSITCRMYRKDRNRPVVVTEYYDECKRDTVPWKMKHRMLRHKALIQAARYAFGFSGIYDEDEGAKIAEMKDITPTGRPVPPKPPVPPSENTVTFDGETGEIIDGREVVTETGEATDAIDDDSETLGDYFTKFEETMAATTSAADIAEVWNDFDPLSKFEGDEDNQALALSIKRKHVQRVGAK